jgi:hypothetical protein
MHLDISTLQRNGRTYKRVLLRTSYRENGKVKKRTLANLSACSDEEINECDPHGNGINVSLLEHVSPIEWENVVLYGEYVINRDLIRSLIFLNA